jgi:sigma-E factor negative regulatory protein RseA
MKDRISEFMDGELDDRAAAPLIDALGRDGEARDAWRTYHLIGDALRDSSLLSPGFTARVARALEAEPTVLAPRRLQPQPRTWYALAASVAGFALVGWLAFAPQQTAIAPVAQQQSPALAQAKPNIVPLPSGTNDYLLAHQAFSPRVSLQGMAPYVRTVSEQAQQEPRK